MESTTHHSVADTSLVFTRSDEQVQALLQRLHEVADLEALGALADWDQQTALPKGAYEARMHQMATLQGLVHERFTHPEIGSLLQKLSERVIQPEFTAADRGLVRQTLHSYNRATKLPRSLVEEQERVRAAGTEAWINARSNNDFATFAPWLTKTIAIQREIADRIGYAETRYDALLDATEPGLTTARVEELFAPVRKVSSDLLQRIQASGTDIDDSILQGTFSIEQQQILCEKILQVIGYDFNHGQLARSAHPFTTSFGSPLDARLTVRYSEQFLQSSLMAALHEGGHGLYEQGQSKSLMRTPLATGASMGMHESQSRLWENAIGRSEAFWTRHYAIVQELFPAQFKNVDVRAFVRALNKVQPSLIRVEADEVTYNLHIIIRFELEQAMVNGEIAVESLPGLWNAKYQEYLGITPPSDADGILQDIHWTSGFGYFPDYTLGNLYSAQIFATLHRLFPDMDERLKHGETGFILQWLRENMYALGTTYLPEDLIQRLTGEPGSPQYFIDYLTHKFTEIYDL
ncbi:carboxypeptidase M32 [Tengunoibacter tsumagoiensis]|uniref:Metal-dependent carboxypeptidase n=1 Tax=Tengunoibacter tsumagoiensis TaxID=2014871 RepID=A0A402A0K8_9CHLR|nr:carboxypeptidase M32 [Tengunoibacter tsumagoiensis]GCE12680.1 carboxypeptidase M32 [Tengunoibacter tsumagoiensis]